PKDGSSFSLLPLQAVPQQIHGCCSSSVFAPAKAFAIFGALSLSLSSPAPPAFPFPISSHLFPLLSSLRPFFSRSSSRRDPRQPAAASVENQQLQPAIIATTRRGHDKQQLQPMNSQPPADNRSTAR
ncbi:hypothetical protein AABB24_039818, partial [Solanum stoloniferum]